MARGFGPGSMPPMVHAPRLGVRPATEADRERWDDAVLWRFGGCPLQTWGWGELRRRHGWTVDRLIAEGPGGEVLGAMTVQTLTRGGLVGFAYSPRGPAVGELAAGAIDHRRRDRVRLGALLDGADGRPLLAQPYLGQVEARAPSLVLRAPQLVVHLHHRPQRHRAAAPDRGRSILVLLGGFVVGGLAWYVADVRRRQRQPAAVSDTRIVFSFVVFVLVPVAVLVVVAAVWLLALAVGAP